MALSNTSSVQESKSEDDLDINEISDEKQADEDYQRLLQESVRMSKTSEKRAVKIKAMEEKNITMQSALTDCQSKVKQLEEQRAILFDKSITASQENERLLQQSQKIEAELVKLRKKLQSCTSEKENFAGKLKMALAELNSANTSINRMNTRSMKLTEILGSQESVSSKIGIGYVQGVRPRPMRL